MLKLFPGKVIEQDVHLSGSYSFPPKGWCPNLENTFSRIEIPFVNWTAFWADPLPYIKAGQAGRPALPEHFIPSRQVGYFLKFELPGWRSFREDAVSEPLLFLKPSPAEFWWIVSPQIYKSELTTTPSQLMKWGDLKAFFDTHVR